MIGNYIVDFYCASAKLVIELDGSQHYETDGIEYDIKRDAELRALGLSVVRYTNLEIKRDFTAVCEDIMSHITPHQPPAAAASPKREACENAIKKPSPSGEGGTAKP